MEILVPNMEHGDYSEGSFKIELQSIQIKWMNLKNEYPEIELCHYIVVIFLIFWGTSMLFSILNILVYISILLVFLKNQFLVVSSILNMIFIKLISALLLLNSNSFFWIFFVIAFLKFWDRFSFESERKWKWSHSVMSDSLQPYGL